MITSYTTLSIKFNLNNLRKSVKKIIWENCLKESFEGIIWEKAREEIFDERRRNELFEGWNSKREQIEQFYWLKFLAFVSSFLSSFLIKYSFFRSLSNDLLKWFFQTIFSNDFLNWFSQMIVFQHTFIMISRKISRNIYIYMYDVEYICYICSKA